MKIMPRVWKKVEVVGKRKGERRDVFEVQVR